MKALALCHNVTPVVEEVEEREEGEEEGEVKMDDEEVVIFHSNSASTSRKISYQASSPDEVSHNLYVHHAYVLCSNNIYKCCASYSVSIMFSYSFLPGKPKCEIL